MSLQDQNVQVNVNTTAGPIMRGQSYAPAPAPVIELVGIDFGTLSESRVSLANPFPVQSLNARPTAPVNFRTQITGTQTNLALATPGFAFRVTSIHVCSKAYASSSGYDNPSVLIGVGTASTPTGAGVIYANAGFPPGTSDGVTLADLAVGTSAQSIFITTGTISIGDVLEVFGVYYAQ